MLYAPQGLSGYEQSVHICEQSRTRLTAPGQGFVEKQSRPASEFASGLEPDTWASDVKRREGVDSGAAVGMPGCITALALFHR